MYVHFWAGWCVLFVDAFVCVHPPTTYIRNVTVQRGGRPDGAVQPQDGAHRGVL